MRIMGNEVPVGSISLGTIGSVLVTTVVMSLAVWVFLDDRYAHAAEVTKQTSALTADMAAQTKTLATQI